MGLLQRMDDLVGYFDPGFTRRQRPVRRQIVKGNRNLLCPSRATQTQTQRQNQNPRPNAKLPAKAHFHPVPSQKIAGIFP
jgi:hypothetical protein